MDRPPTPGPPFDRDPCETQAGKNPICLSLAAEAPSHHGMLARCDRDMV
jgi:hypothetical protein